MPNPAVALIGGGLSAGGSFLAADRAGDASEDAANASAATAARAEALNRERFALAQGYLDPYVGRANIAAQQLQAEMGLPQYTQSALSVQPSVTPQNTAPQGGGALARAVSGVFGKLQQNSTANPVPPMSPYVGSSANEYRPRSMSDIPGFQAVMDESLGAAEQSAMNSGSTLYGGRRLEAAGKVGAGVQQSYYNNYMNLLQNMANPAVATNLAGMGVGQAQSIGQQNIAATGMANDYRMQGVGAQNAAFSDLMGGAVQLGSGYMMGGGMTPAPTPGVWV